MAVKSVLQGISVFPNVLCWAAFGTVSQVDNVAWRAGYVVPDGVCLAGSDAASWRAGSKIRNGRQDALKIRIISFELSRTRLLSLLKMAVCSKCSLQITRFFVCFLLLLFLFFLLFFVFFVPLKRPSDFLSCSDTCGFCVGGLDGISIFLRLLQFRSPTIQDSRLLFHQRS